jgi:hypothetical protein
MSKCLVPRCIRHRPAEHLLCRHHWPQIPEPVRDEVWRYYRLAPGGPDHRHAVINVIRLAREMNP